LRDQPIGQKEFTVGLPNTFNISFDFESVIFIVIPILYALIFPGLYGHMWVHRSKHYAAFAKERSIASLIVPD
jgi:hypothetical protein